MARTLVTGARGFVGRNLVAHLRELGETVIDSACDLSDRRETEWLFQTTYPTHVYHCAGRVRGIAGNMANQEAAYRENVLINTNVVEMCVRYKVEKVVALGTVAMYGGAGPHFREDGILGAPPHSSEFGYAVAKRGMLAHLQTTGLAWAMPICTNMYGPHDRFDKEHGHCVPALVRKFHEGEPVVWGDGTQKRDFLYIRDAVRALHLLMEKGDGIINLATGQSSEIVEVCGWLSSFSGHSWIYDERKPMGQKERSYDVSRIAAMGWKPQYCLGGGLKETYDWYVANSQAARKR